MTMKDYRGDMPGMRRKALLRGLQQSPAAAASLNVGNASQPFQVSNATDTSNEHNDATASNEHSRLDQSTLVILLSFMVLSLVIVWLFRKLCRHPLDERQASAGQVHAGITHEGRIFHLTGHQRRAVLEAIFSETSKPVTESDVKKKSKREKQRSFLGFPLSVAMLHIHTVATDTSAETNPSSHSTNDGGADATDASNDRDSNFVSTAFDSDEESQNVDVENEGVVASDDDHLPTDEVVASSKSIEAGSTHASHSQCQTGAGHSALHSMRPTEPAAPSGDDEVLGLSEKPAARLERGVADTKDDNDDDIKSLGDGEDGSAPMPSELPCARHESCAAVTSEHSHDDDDDSVGENVCSICLGEYEAGELMVGSKYCTHIFHKDCLLEWLENHDECPICRVGMVTDSEISKAATAIVGKTRMYRAVASFHAPHVRRNPSSQQPHHQHQHRRTHPHPHQPPRSSLAPMHVTVRYV